MLQGDEARKAVRGQGKSAKPDEACLQTPPQDSILMQATRRQRGARRKQEGRNATRCGVGVNRRLSNQLNADGFPKSECPE